MKIYRLRKTDSDDLPRKIHPVTTPQLQQHPLVALQGVIGNRAVQRLLIQRDTRLPSMNEIQHKMSAEAHRQRSEDETYKFIVNGLDALEGAFLPADYPRVRPVIHPTKAIFLATGTITHGVLNHLEKRLISISPRAKNDLNERFYQLGRDIDEWYWIVDGKKDPVQWQTEHYDRVAGYKPKGAKPRVKAPD